MFSEIKLGEQNQFMIKIFRQIRLRKYLAQSIQLFGGISVGIGQKTQNISKKEVTLVVCYFIADLRYIILIAFLSLDYLLAYGRINFDKGLSSAKSFAVLINAKCE